MSSANGLSGDERKELEQLIATGPYGLIKELARVYLTAWSPKDERLVRAQLIITRRRVEEHGRQNNK